MYPKKIKKGATIGVVALSSPGKMESLNQGKANLEKLGYKVVLGESCYSTYAGYLSGDDNLRASDLNKMFKDDSIDAIMCLKGGYGTPRIVDKIDYEMIKKNKKIFCGFSDVTLLLNTIYDKCDLVTFHGPMMAIDFTDNFSQISIDSFNDVVIEQKRDYVINENNKHNIETIGNGTAKGILVGGNLSLVDVMIGTPYQIDFKNKILLLEEVNEPPYRVDRMLQKLRLSGILNELNGIVIGSVTYKNAVKTDYGYYELFKEFLEPLNIPVLYGLPIGHITSRLTVPIGAKVEINTKDFTLKIL
ncbi:MAG: LD-carboxypeptidase [Candidatus Izimaplasma sp.]|nr:LD-carboxypeptidase [Candidatus Izimaplasma bacterium]